MSWSVLLAARVDCCSGSLSAVFVTCAGVMLWQEWLPRYISRGLGVLATPPPPGGGQLLTSILFIVPLLRLRVFRQLLACWDSKSVSACLAGPGVIFLRAGVLQACFVLLHPCLRILLAIHSEATACMRQLMCTAVILLLQWVSQLSSDQLVPLHHNAHFMYPACLFFLYICEATACMRPKPALMYVHCSSESAQVVRSAHPSHAFIMHICSTLHVYFSYYILI
jgi:hypothetical protein